MSYSNAPYPTQQVSYGATYGDAGYPAQDYWYNGGQSDGGHAKVHHSDSSGDDPVVIHIEDNQQSTKESRRGLAFSDVDIRRKFIRKVFGLLTVMLFTVAIITCLFMFVQPLKDFIRHNFWVYICAYVVFIVVYIALMCCENVRRKHPGNLIACGALSMSIGLMTACITAYHDVIYVMIAMCATCLICAGVMLFAAFTKIDFTKCMGIMCVLGLFVLVFGIVSIIVAAVTQVKTMYMIYCGLGTLLFIGFLIMDVQMVMGGKKYEIDEEEYVFAAIQIFLDIVYIFWFILILIGGGDH